MPVLLRDAETVSDIAEKHKFRNKYAVCMLFSRMQVHESYAVGELFLISYSSVVQCWANCVYENLERMPASAGKWQRWKSCVEARLRSPGK